MKTTLFVIIISLVCINVRAQEKKNAIKVLPLNLTLNSAVFEYEHMLNEKNAFEFGIGIPTSRTFVNKYGMSWSEDENISNDKLGIFSLRAAYRHYTGKSMLPKGFYIAPYIRYQGISASADNVRTIDYGQENSSYDENYDAKIHTIGAGCQLGYQFLISETITLDFFFFGFEAGLGSIDANVYVSDPNEVTYVYDDIRDAVNDLPSIWSNHIDVTSGNNNINIKGKNLFTPMYRGGFSLGIAF